MVAHVRSHTPPQTYDTRSYHNDTQPHKVQLSRLYSVDLRRVRNHNGLVSLSAWCICPCSVQSNSTVTYYRLCHCENVPNPITVDLSGLLETIKFGVMFGDINVNVSYVLL